MFDSSIDAFLYAVRSGGSTIMNVPASIGYMKNGIKRCSVQVSCDGGNGGDTGYSIEAYGKEAEALYQEAIKYSKREHRMVIV